jgi:hypothetical protein
MLWSRKSTPIHERSRHAGIDVTASRMLGVSIGSGKVRGIPLDGERDELPLFIVLLEQPPEIGRAGYSLCRKLPHVVCSNFLPALGQLKDKRSLRLGMTPDAALELAFQKIHEPVLTESELVVLSLPAYLAPIQVARVTTSAARAKFPLKGTAVGPLALVAMRAAAVATGKPAAGTSETPPAPDWVLRLRPTVDGPGAVVVIDADEFALSAVVATVERDRVRLVASGFWPRFSRKAWKDRLIESVSDRCVRLCRRDPRDSAEAEQSLFEQLDDALNRAHDGQPTNLKLRTAHWFQELIQQPEDLTGACASLARSSSEAIQELLSGTGLPLPPRAIWLTQEASRLPGLHEALHLARNETTALEALPRGALAHAAATLVARWLASELPLAHLDSVIPLPALRTDAPGEKPKTGKR